MPSKYTVHCISLASLRAVYRDIYGSGISECTTSRHTMAMVTPHHGHATPWPWSRHTIDSIVLYYLLYYLYYLSLVTPQM